jgi:hypothetical protein
VALACHRHRGLGAIAAERKLLTMRCSGSRGAVCRPAVAVVAIACGMPRASMCFQVTSTFLCLSCISCSQVLAAHTSDQCHHTTLPSDAAQYTHRPCNQRLHIVQLQTTLCCLVQSSAWQRPIVASLLAHRTGRDTAAATGPIKVAKSLSKCGATQADAAPNKPKQCMHWSLRGHHAQRCNSSTQHL